MSHSLAQGEATCGPDNMGHGNKAKVTFSWPCSLLTPVVFANMVSILRDSLLSVLQLFPMHCNVNIVSHLRWTRMTYIYINCLLRANIWVFSVLSTYMTFFHLRLHFCDSIIALVTLIWWRRVTHIYINCLLEANIWVSSVLCIANFLPEKYRMKRFARP